MSPLLFVFFCLGYAGSERILAVFPFTARSHFFVFEPLMSELATRGHQVTVISQFPRKIPMANYTDIGINANSIHENGVPLPEVVNIDMGVSLLMPELLKISEPFEDIYKLSAVQELLNSNVKFDLVIGELFICDMFIPLADKYKVPLMMMSSSEIMPWAADRLALPDNPSYIQHFFSTISGPMTFYERLSNTAELIYMKWYYKRYITPNDERVSRKYLGNVASVEDMMKRTNLVLVNSHLTVNRPRPLPPHVVEVGGIHIKPAKPLPQDIEEFLNESEHGVIYFSLGSIVNASTMEPETRRAFCNVFSKLKQRVLWKWELDEMPEKPDNVRIMKWIPQRDVLAHPKVRLFMGHGGLLGTMEAIYSGVPMIGIPVFGDQRQNIARLENLGYALKLNLRDLKEDDIEYAINRMLKDQKFANTAQQISEIFRDRQASALDTAVYWTEYLLRHGGLHLIPAAVELPWYQYLLLDVIGALVLCLVAIVIVFVYLVKLVLRKFGLKQKLKVS